MTRYTFTRLLTSYYVFKFQFSDTTLMYFSNELSLFATSRNDLDKEKDEIKHSFDVGKSLKNTTINKVLHFIQNFPVNEIDLKIAYIIIGVTFLTYLLTIYGLKYLSPTVSSSYIYFQPVLVIIFAFLFTFLNWSADYTDTITIQKMGYMLMIFTGVYLTSVMKQKR